MSFSPRVHKKNNIKYSNSASNALLNLAQTKAAETIILENMLQSRLDKIERAKKKGKKFGMFKNIVSKIIPGKIDDAILSIADAAYKDRLRSSAFGGIDTGQVTLLADAAREIDSQAIGFSKELMKDMKFSASAKNFVSQKMMAQLAELPEIKEAQDKFNSLGLKEKFIPKNMLDFVKSASDTSAKFMKNPVGFMKRYERDPITKELVYAGTTDYEKYLSATTDKEKNAFYESYKRKRDKAGLSSDLFLEGEEYDSGIAPGSINLTSEVEDLADDFTIEETPITALDVITQEKDAASLMLDTTLLQEMKQGLPDATPEAIELSQEIESMVPEPSIDLLNPNFSSQLSMSSNTNLPKEVREDISNLPSGVFYNVDELSRNSGKFHRQGQLGAMRDFVDNFGTYGPGDNDPNAVVKIQDAFNVFSKKFNESRGYKLNPVTGRYE